MLEPGTLWQRVHQQTAVAERAGALFSIPTASERLEDRGVSFLVRVVGNLERKDAQRRALDTAGGERPNPFLPYEPTMHVADLSDSHVCLLNKFNVVDHHILIVTRAFEAQERLLTLADFEAMWIGLLEYDGLAFYNGGEMAGASQPHKHLQQVPLPLAADGPRVPIESLLPTGRSGVHTAPGLPFVHAVARPSAGGSAAKRARESVEQYREMLAAVGLPVTAVATDQPAPYNLLATRDWLLLVPRAAESFAGNSLNALAFAGALLVRNAAQLEQLRRAGPMTALEKTAGRWPTSTGRGNGRL